MLNSVSDRAPPWGKASFKLTLHGCVVSVWCVGLAINFIIAPGMLVCSSFLISVCMFIVSKALLISSATVIVSAGGAIWLNPFSTVLFNVCSAVNVECCFCTCVAWVCLVCLLLCKEECSSPVS